VPIRFNCPSCQAKLSVPDDKVGVKAPCPKCGQRLQVPRPAPPPPADRTLLGELDATDPMPTSAQFNRSLDAAVAARGPANIITDAPVSSGQIQFTCPFCSASVKAADSQRNKNSRCPKCKEPIRVPDTDGGLAGDPVEDVASTQLVPHVVASPVQMQPASQSVACPFCGESILAVAKKCKHCNEMLDPTLRAAQAPVNQVVVQQVVNQQTAVVDYGRHDEKSVGLAILLAFLFGPLGMLYSTVGGAIIMFLTNVVLGIMTLGLIWLLTWPVCVIWAAVAADSHNRSIHRRRVNMTTNYSNDGGGDFNF